MGDWVTIYKIRNIYIRCRRLPLSKVYSSISETSTLHMPVGLDDHVSR